MADVNSPIEATDRDRVSSRGGSRAQLIIVTGLAIGVTLIALVVILNTVIYTENLATRSAGVGGQDAIQYRAMAIEATGGVLDRENLEDYDAQSKATDNVTHGVDRVDRFLRLQYVEGETAAEMTNVSADNGTIVRQTDPGRLYEDDDFTVGPWTVVTGAGEDDLRQFDLTVTSSTVDPAATDPSSGFNVTVIDSVVGNEWRLSVYESGGGVTLAVHNASQSGATRGICGSPYTDARVEIDLTAGTVEDQPCHAIQFARGLSGTKAVEFVRGTRAGGTFNVTVNESGGATPAFLNLNPPGGGSPYFAEAVYSLRFDVHYEQPRLTYHDRVRVAPDEAS